MVTEERSDMMMMMVVPNHKVIISLANVSLLWLEISPSLPPMCEKESLAIVEERLTRLMNINYLAGDNDIHVHGVLKFLNIFTSIFEDATFGWLSYFMFPFFLFLFSPITSKNSALRYFWSGEVDSSTQIRVPHGGFIIYQSHILLI